MTFVAEIRAPRRGAKGHRPTVRVVASWTVFAAAYVVTTIFVFASF